MDSASSEELLRSLNFCVIDLETTGGNPQTDKIIEIGMIKVENLKLTEERSFMVNPQKDIPEFVQRLTGIKQADVTGSPLFEEIADEVAAFAGNSILVAHNTSFDIPFLNAKLKQSGRPTLDNKVICTNIMTKYMIPDIVNSNLNYMAQIFGLDQTQAHRAIEDARATGRLLLKFLEIFQKKNIRKVNQLYYPRNRFELDRLHFDTQHNTMHELLDFLAAEDRSVVLQLKGGNGIILSTLPIESPKNEIELIKKFLSDMPWAVATVKLAGTFFEALMQFNGQYLKTPEDRRGQAIEYLKQRLPEIKQESSPLEKEDFLVVPHLIQGQFSVYGLMNLGPHSQLVFKYPAHKKKLGQFLSGQIARFESAKQRRRNTLCPEIRPLIHSLLSKMQQENHPHYLFLKRDIFKKDPKEFFNPLERLAKDLPDPFVFPAKHY